MIFCQSNDCYMPKVCNEIRIHQSASQLQILWGGGGGGGIMVQKPPATNLLPPSPQLQILLIIWGRSQGPEASSYKCHIGIGNTGLDGTLFEHFEHFYFF